MNIFVVALILMGVIGLYILTYYFNDQTDAPDGVESLSKCSTCGSGSCSFVGSDAKIQPDNCELEELKID